MKVAGWALAAGALLVVAHWWPLAYALMAIAAVLGLAAHDPGPDRRRRWPDSRRV